MKVDRKKLFRFTSDISRISIPFTLNNPFADFVPAIAKIAALEFQAFIANESQKWDYDISVKKGKMFGVLVVQLKDNSYGFLGAVSGKLPAEAQCFHLIPSVFDISTGDYFINRGMTELSEILNTIKNTSNPTEVSIQKEKSKAKSIALQQRLFENYHFTNLSGQKKNLIDIFKTSSHGYPPTAAGECATPKLLQYAIEHKLKPTAVAEFWWGSSMSNNAKKHKTFYPACKDRCRPILEYMLEDIGLFDRRIEKLESCT